MKAVPHIRENVLVVDASASNRHLLNRILRRHGYQVFMAESMTEALIVCAAADTHLDLLIVDAMNTGVPGPHVAAIFGKRYPNLRCLYVISYDNLAETILLPLAPLVVKPLDDETILHAIRLTMDAD